MTETVETTPCDDIGLSERLRKTLGGVEPDDFGGDNLAIFIASELEPSIEDETLDESLTWKQGALDACDRVLDAIHAHYATHLDAQAARVKELEAARMGQIDYSVDLQRIIEGLCHGRTIREPQTGARHHYDMAIEYQARALRAEQERDVAKVVERESFQKYVDANEARIDALRDRDEAVALLVRVNTLAQMPAWRRMPDGASFSTTSLAGDIAAAIRRLAADDEEGK